MSHTLLTDVLDLLRDLPDWLAWRMDSWVVKMRDRELSPVVWDILKRGDE